MVCFDVVRVKCQVPIHSAVTTSALLVLRMPSFVQAPRGGYGSVSPVTGTALSTAFEISAAGWTDEASVSQPRGV